MKVTVSKEQVNKELRELIPTRFLFRQNILLKCEEKESLMGAAVIEKLGKEYQLSWIWVRNTHRRMGAGSMLLDTAIELVKKLGCDRLTVVYDTVNKNSAILSYMLSKRKFELKENSTPVIRVNKEQLLESPLLTMPMKLDKRGIKFIPLQYLTPEQLRSMIVEYERRGTYLISRADYLNADRRNSMVLAIGEGLGGMTVLRQTQNEGCFVLDLLFLDKKAGSDGVRLLRKTAENLLSPIVHFNSIEFVCVEDSALALADKLLGDKKMEWKLSTEAALWI